VRVIFLPTAEAVVALNKFICEQGRNPHNCNEIGKVESAISTAFYPGVYPFAHGGLSRVAAALCFYLVKSHAFIDGCAAGSVAKEQLMMWFETHKIYLEEDI
jgi:prophage maintenance system killer protein